MSGREIDEIETDVVTVYCPYCGEGIEAVVTREEGGTPDEDDWQAEVERHGCLRLGFAVRVRVGTRSTRTARRSC